MPPSETRSLPFGAQFSPDQTPLPDLLTLLEKYAGNQNRLNEAIQASFFSDGDADAYNRRKKADNTLLALRNYGVLGEDKATPTDFGRTLIGLRTDEPTLYSTFARHILLNLNGLALVRVIQDELRAEREVSLNTLPYVLERRGLKVPPTATHISAMKGWLKQSGVFTGGRTSYEIDDGRVEELIGGLTTQELDALSDFDAVQRAFLKALLRLPLGEWHASNTVASAAEIAYGVQFPWKSIKSVVLDACFAAGFIQYRKTTEGRGAKPYEVRTTDKFVAEVVEPLLKSHSDPIGGRLREYLRTPMARIIENLSSDNKNIKGKALELLAVGLIFTLDLDFVGWRKRGTATGGAEVDVLAESARLIYSRWQIQCKNGRANLEDVAKEVGLAYHLNSNVILVLTTQRFSRDTNVFADSIMRKSNLQIVLLDSNDLAAITMSPANLFGVLHAHSRHALKVKALREGAVFEAESTTKGDTDNGGEEA
jgi:site-specific DNA-methyltransferase (cytosine-N4-specific)